MVLLFIGIITVLLIPSNSFVLTESLDGLGLLGSRLRVPGLAETPPGPGPAPPLWFVNGILWDAAEGTRPNPGLGVVAGRITARRDPRARVIDLDGMTMLPGLIDMHVHALGGTFDGEMMIGAGVTTARDLGSNLHGVLRRREQSESGGRIGPHLLVTGPYLVGSAGTTDQEIGVAGPADAARIVREFARAGVDGIKVHRGISPGILERVSREAHERGLWVAAHLDRIAPAEAARLGVDTIEHAAGLDGSGGAGAIAALIENDVAVTPTLVVAENAFRIRELARRDNPALAFFPSFFRRAWIRSQLANARASRLEEAEILRRRERLERLERFVGLFHRAGGRVLAGSDAPAFLVPPGFGLHRELELLVAAGLTPGQAFEAATSEAARALGRDNEIGGLAAGMRADLLIVRGNPASPRDGMAAIRETLMVLRDGHILLNRLD